MKCIRFKVLSNYRCEQTKIETMDEIATLLNKLILLGRKPFGLGYLLYGKNLKNFKFRYVPRQQAFGLTLKKHYREHFFTLLEIISENSGLRPFCCANGLIKGNSIWCHEDADADLEVDKYDESDPMYWYLECMFYLRFDEKNIGNILLKNIKVDGF